MAASESLREVAQTRPPLSTWLGIVLLFGLFGMVVLAVVGPSPRGDDYEKTRAKKRMENLKTLLQEEEKALTTYSWGDKTKGTVHIPIDRAVELTMAELSAKKPAPAGPIATPPPSATPAAQPAASAVPGSPSGAPAAQPAVSPGAAPTLRPAGSPFPIPGKQPNPPKPS